MISRVLVVAGLCVAAGAAFAQSKPRPATQLAITNARDVPATEVSVSVADTTVSLPKPLAPNGRATLRLPRMEGCTVAILASFEDEAVVEMESFDVCKDKSVRFTD